MKSVIFLLFFVLTLTVLCKAQNLIAVEHGSSTTFYTRLDSALSHASNGDNVYLPGGYIQYTGTLIIKKAFNIIGVGYNVDSSSVTSNSIILSSGIQINPSASGGSIIGIYTSSNLTILDTVTSYKIQRCFTGAINVGSGAGSIPVKNINIIETIINGTITGNTTSNSSPFNVLISNCFILGSGSPIYASSAYYGYYWNGIICRNSVLKGTSSTYGSAFFANRNSLFDNCVIIDGSQIAAGGTQNTFNNCLFNFSNSYISSYPDNIIYNCIYNQNTDSIFINSQGNYYDIHNNYHLKSTSPGKNAGTDGQDIGLYGGNYPWKEGGIPFNPHIQYKKISGTTNSNGTLPVQIKVKAQDN